MLRFGLAFPYGPFFDQNVFHTTEKKKQNAE